MLPPALVALCAATIATGAMAQSTGIAICDDFLKKYEVCVNTKYSAAMRKISKDSLDLEEEHDNSPSASGVCLP